MALPFVKNGSGPVSSVAAIQSFLNRKLQCGEKSGFKPLWMPSCLFDFQGLLTEWNLWKGRSLTAADCGMGKTLMELVWAENVIRKTNKRVLILTPLAVAQQTIREADKFHIQADRTSGELHRGINVSNYEKLHQFSPGDFGGIVCDESSCLKSFDGVRRAAVTEFLRTIPYRLLATATPAPNDYIELGTSSEALGELGHIDMLNRFFVNDRNTSDTRKLYRRSPAMGGPVDAGWRFKGHAEIPFYRYLCGWMRACRKPSDVGRFSDTRFVLPQLIEREHCVETRTLADGWLLPMAATNMREEREERRRTIQERCEKAAELVANTGKPFVIWCQLNPEGNLLEKLLKGHALEVSGKDSDEAKEEAYEAFASGQSRGIITKQKIGGWGLNWQHCAHVVEFVSHSWEAHFQGVRRCLRFGQESDVTNDLIFTEGQRPILVNMARKAAAADRMFGLLVEHMNDVLRIESVKDATPVEVPAWL